jgi:hypothetical protein
MLFPQYKGTTESIVSPFDGDRSFLQKSRTCVRSFREKMDRGSSDTDKTRKRLETQLRACKSNEEFLWCSFQVLPFRYSGDMLMRDEKTTQTHGFVAHGPEDFSTTGKGTTLGN